MGIPHPVTGSLEPHNTWLVSDIDFPPETIANAHKADEVKDYVGWGVENGFGVIDVNIPKYISKSIGVSLSILLRTSLEVNKQTQRLPQREGEDANRAKMADRLAVYIWENYIEYVTIPFTTHHTPI